VASVEVNGYTIEPRAHLPGADLRGADLVGANLREADLTAADLTGAIADKNTTWPDGFDPVAAGVIFE
jgi:uncharacterized protein YjbI with pentapeptide repeats